MGNNPNVSLEDLKRAMNDPMVKNSPPDQLIANLSNVLGIADLDPVDQSEVEKVRDIYFQAFKLEAERWTPMPGNGFARNVTTYVQIIPFKLKWVPDGVQLVADVLIDKTDYEEECFQNCVQGMAVRGKNMVFYSNTAIPIDITLGLKCIDVNGDVVRVPDECYMAKKK